MQLWVDESTPATSVTGWLAGAEQVLEQVRAVRTKLPRLGTRKLRHKITPLLRAQGVRVEVDDSDERMQKKIRTAQKQKVPFMLLAGAEDEGQGAVSFRYRDGSQKNGIPIADAITEIAEAIESRRQV